MRVASPPGAVDPKYIYSFELYAARVIFGTPMGKIVLISFECQQENSATPEEETVSENDVVDRGIEEESGN